MSIDVTFLTQRNFFFQPVTFEYRNKCEFTVGVDPDGNGEIPFIC